MNESKKYKHMLPEDRIEIQERLCKGMTFNTIARRIGKDPTTVLRSGTNNRIAAAVLMQL